MINSSSFLNSHWFWPIIVIASVIWLVYVWKERSNYPKSKFFISAVVAFIAIAALTLIVLKPLKPTSGKPYKAAILTTGYNTNQLDSLKRVYKDLLVVQYNNDETLFNDLEKPEAVFLLGNGLRAFDLWQLHGIKTTYLDGDETQGITAVNYNNHNIVGNKLHIKGRYLTGLEGTKIILETPSGIAVDSITLTSAKKQDFELSTSLKAKGKFIYVLKEKDSSNTVVTENPLPVLINDKAPLRILMINDFPTFETKYLKNYLAKSGHEIVIRSQLTRSRYKYEYFNLKNRPAIDFSQKNLAFFDLMIIDASSLRKRSRNQISSIERSISEDGLGVFVQPDISYLNTNNQIMKFRFNQNRNTSTTFSSHPRIKINTFPYHFKSEYTLQSIQTSGTKVLSAYKRLGIGKVGTAIIRNSYELILNGHQELYQTLWSKTLENLSKRALISGEWQTAKQLAFPNEPMDFTLRTHLKNPRVQTEQAHKIALQQDINIPNVWRGRVYPKHRGWHSLTTLQDSSLVMNYYINNTSDWKTLTGYETMLTNKRFFNAQNKSTIPIDGPVKPIKLLWLYILFLVSIGFLWLQPKL